MNKNIIHLLINNIFFFSQKSFASKSELFSYDKSKVNASVSQLQHLEKDLTDAGIMKGNFNSTLKIENSVKNLNLNSSDSLCNQLMFSDFDDEDTAIGACFCIGIVIIGLGILIVKLW
mgnify:CR=1 FL=1